MHATLFALLLGLLRKVSTAAGCESARRSIKRFLVAAGMLVYVALHSSPLYAADPPVESSQRHDDRMAWWREARFGMFIHWGIYAVPADGEWYLHQHKVPLDQYEKYATQFNPVKFDADQWAQLAKDAGMKYLVITSKHHDGFCMFKTCTTKYNVVDASPWGQDPLAVLSAACQKRGIRFCCYYSIMDWHAQLPAKADPEHPEYNPTSFATPAKKAEYIAYMKTQLKELITQYHPAVIWFDGGWMNGWTADDGKDLVAYLRRLDSDLIINDRAIGVGDYGTPEQSIPARGLGRDWETCMTINNNWGFSANDHDFKSTQTLLRNLIDIASKGGNYLLNVGPTAEGVIPGEEVERLQQMGAWLKINGAAIYGSTAGPFPKQLPWGRCTQQPGKLFLEVFDWPKDGKLRVPVVNKVSQAYTLTEPDKMLEVVANDEGSEITLPAVASNSIASVVVLRIDGPAQVAPAASGIVAPQADGSIKLQAADADIIGSDARLEGAGESNVGYWTNANDYLRWTAKVDSAGEYQVLINYACPKDSDGSEYSVSVGSQSVSGKVKSTGSWTDYAVVQLGAVNIDKPGPVSVTLKPTSKPNLAVMNLRTVALKPTGR